MMADNPEERMEKRVDEGWKAKVREEKEALNREEEAVQADAGPAEDGDAAGGDEAGAEAAYPPPTFTGLAAGLAAQAFMALGLVENPVTGKVEKDLAAARHLLDTLGMLQEKTEGNLSDDEKAYVEDLLYNLRMAFVKETA
jgi:hypothetical protein